MINWQRSRSFGEIQESRVGLRDILSFELVRASAKLESEFLRVGALELCLSLANKNVIEPQIRIAGC